MIARPRFRRVAPLAWLGIVLVIVAGIAASPGTGLSQARTTLERRVKAAFLYKFTGYIEWPEHAFRESNTPLVIGVVGDRPLAEVLGRLVEGRTAGGRPVTVRALDDVEAAGDLQMIFVPRSRTEALDELRSRAPRPLLVVSETPDGLSRGSVINFNLVQGHVRFEISLPAAERAGLTLSSRLLSVAQSVVTQER